MTTVTQAELAQLAHAAGEKIRDVLIPFMRIGASVSLEHKEVESRYLTTIRHGGYTHSIIIGIPIFGERNDG